MNLETMNPEKNQERRKTGREENRKGCPYPIVRMKFPAFLIEFESHKARKRRKVTSDM